MNPFMSFWSNQAASVVRPATQTATKKQNQFMTAASESQATAYRHSHEAEETKALTEISPPAAAAEEQHSAASSVRNSKKRRIHEISSGACLNDDLLPANKQRRTNDGEGTRLPPTLRASVHPSSLASEDPAPT
jgi:hypothetical protein